MSPPRNRHSGSSTHHKAVGCQPVDFLLSCLGEDRRGTSVQGSHAVEDLTAHVRCRYQQHATDRVDGRVRLCAGHGQAVERRRVPRGRDVPPRPRASSTRQGPDRGRPPKGNRPTGSCVGNARSRRTLKMSIRDNYVSTFKSIRKQFGAGYSGPKISADTSLKKAIGYTREYVVEHSQQHFRYDYYQRALSSAIKRLRFDPVGRRVVHLDIGCGPGLFSWVMHDHMELQYAHNSASVNYFGYDHAAAMIRLAHLFWDRLPVRYDYSGYSGLGEISAALAHRYLSNHDVVVTFGYVLVQVQDSPSAMEDFATLVHCLFPLHSCIVVVADAHNDSTIRGVFRDQCSALQAALDDVGVRFRKEGSQ